MSSTDIFAYNAYKFLEQIDLYSKQRAFGENKAIAPSDKVAELGENILCLAQCWGYCCISREICMSGDMYNYAIAMRGRSRISVLQLPY